MTTTSSTSGLYSPTRITGLATGLDIDSLVKAEMQPYNIKVDTTKQARDTLQIQQTMYRDVIQSGQNLYNNYFDITKSDSLLSSKNYATTKFAGSDSNVTATALAGAVKDNYTVNVQQLATTASAQLTSSDFTGLTAGSKITIEGVDILKTDLDAATTLQDKATLINSKISSLGLKASYSDFTGKITVETTATGALNSSGTANTFSMTVNGVDASVTTGKNLKATVSNSKGTVYYGYSKGETLPAGLNLPGGNTVVPSDNDDIIKTSTSNTVTLDGVQFKMQATTGASNTTLTASTDTSAIKDKIVKFFNDYNTYITKLNTLVSDVHDRDYKPLSDSQKSGMTDSEITAWNVKVQKGQLHNDNDVSRLADELKSGMGDPVLGLSTDVNNLKKIGITPVKDYDTKNGTFTINEDTLTTALENDPNAVMALFTNVPTNTTGQSTSQVTSETGIAYRLKNTLYSETVSSTNSLLIQKAGMEGTLYVTSNTLSKQIASYNKKITDLTSDLSTREQGFYTKYSKLESAMQSLNNQSSYLQSQLGSL